MASSIVNVSLVDILMTDLKLCKLENKRKFNLPTLIANLVHKRRD